VQHLLPYADIDALVKPFGQAPAAAAAAAAAGAGGCSGELAAGELPGQQLLAGLAPAERAWLLADVARGLLLPAAATAAEER
jgi:hypothetical protein